MLNTWVSLPRDSHRSNPFRWEHIFLCFPRSFPSLFMTKQELYPFPSLSSYSAAGITIAKNKKIKKELETALKRVTDAESKIKDAEEKVSFRFINFRLSVAYRCDLIDFHRYSCILSSGIQTKTPDKNNLLSGVLILIILYN